MAIKAPQGSDGRLTLAVLGIIGAAAGGSLSCTRTSQQSRSSTSSPRGQSSGIVQIYAAIQLRKEVSNEWLLLLAGVLSIAFGVLLFINPSAGALSLVWIIGFYAVMYGTTMLVLAYKLRRLGDHIRRAVGASR